MWRMGFLALFLMIAIALHADLTKSMWRYRAQIRNEIAAGYVLPSKFSSVLALGYKGLLSDYLFLKTVTFYGERHVSKKALSELDWEYVISSLDVLTDLDPYFEDPYVFAEGCLAWEGRVVEANRILEKGRKYRTWDWRIPYFIGFNYFFFLHDYEKGGEFIMEAAKIPGSHSFLSTLGARLAYYGGKSQTAVLFLKEMIAGTRDPQLRNRLIVRLEALQMAAELELLIERFKREHGRAPQRIDELVMFGYVDSLPIDPYGGQWTILRSGRVYSTSKFTYIRKKE